MKYLILGSGGTGGNIGAFLHLGGKDVTFIARGAHLNALLTTGLNLESDLIGHHKLFPIKACTMATYDEQPDVIFVCVKSYNLADIIPFINRISHAHTLIVPVLNILHTGDNLAKELTKGYILDASIYIVGYINSPGHIIQSSKIFKLIFGQRPTQDVPQDQLENLKNDLCESHINAHISHNIEHDTFEKFSFISPFAATEAYYRTSAKTLQSPGLQRDTFIKLLQEIRLLGEAKNICFNFNIVTKNLIILDQIAPDSTASMYKDLMAGRPSEINELVFEVIREAHSHGLILPTYEHIVASLSEMSFT